MNGIDDGDVMIIEEMKESYKMATGRGNLEGPLHDKRRVYIGKVHVLEFSKEGVYVGKNFGQNPHYMINKKQLTEIILPTCERWGIPIKRYPRNNKVSSSKILCIWQGGSSDTSCSTEKRTFAENTIDALQRHMVSMDYDQLYSCSEDLANHQDEDSKHFDEVNASRGAKQKHFGYTSNHSLSRIVEDGKASVRPALIGGSVPPAWARRFVVMTSIGDAIYEDPASASIRKGSSCGLYDDCLRNASFARKIHDENKIEALTYSETSTQGTTLKIHVDSNNDETENGIKHNYHYITCAWRLFTKPNGTIVRIAIIGYSRRSVSDFFLRQELCRTYTEKYMSPWLDNMPVWRSTIDVTTNVFSFGYYSGIAKIDNDGNIHFLPTLNKQATFLSSFADAFLQFKDVYEKVCHKKMTVEKHLELILPVVFSPSAEMYCSILNRWTSDKLCVERLSVCSQNLSMLYLSEANEQYGSFGSVRYPRHQPSFNNVPDGNWIRSALLCLRETVILSLRDKNYSFKMMTEKIRNVKHIGPLLAQHVIHVMAMISLIHPAYGSESRICEGTQTSKRLHRKHSIPPSTQPSLLNFVSASYSWLPSIAENAICKCEQAQHTRFQDVIYRSQKSVMWIVKESDSFRVAHVNRVLKVEKQKTCSRKLKPVFCGRMIPFEKTGSSKECADASPAESSKWWLDVSESEMRILESHRSPSKKRKPRNQSTGMTENSSLSRKKRKISGETEDSFQPVTVLPSFATPPPPSPPDWLVLDRKEMQRVVSQYEKDVKSSVLKASKEFVEERKQNGTALRIVHAMGKHYCVPSRWQTGHSKKTDSAKQNTILGETKGVTHLMSMGVPVIQFNLLRAAEKYLILSWKMNTENQRKDTRANYFLTMKTVLLRSRSVDLKFIGVTYFVMQAKLMKTTNGVQEQCQEIFIPCEAFGTNGGMIHDGAVQGKFSHVRKSSDDHSLRFEHEFRFGYTTVIQAKTSMLWYLLWTHTKPAVWLAEYIPSPAWVSLKDDVAVAQAGTHMSPKYVLVGLENGPKNSNKGGVFCTLIRTAKQGTWIRLELGYGCTNQSIDSNRTHGGFFHLCASNLNTILENSMVNHTTADGVLDEQRQVAQCDNAFVPLCTDAHPKLAHPHAVPNSVEKKKDFCDRVVGDFSVLPNGKTHSRRTLLVDPFNLNDDNEFNQMKNDLMRWHAVWGDLIGEWNSTLVLRNCSEATDKYWHPPGTRSDYRAIRSKRNLRQFLDLCCNQFTTNAIQSENRGKSTTVDFVGAIDMFSKM